MKNTKLILIFAIGFSGSMALADQPLTGTYRAIDSEGCANESITSAHPVSITASESAIRVDEPGNGALYSFEVGTETSAPSSSFFNEYLNSFAGAYSTGGTQFKAVETLLDRLIPNGPGQYIGEVDFTLKNDTLEIDDSLATDGQPVASPVSTCLLNRVKTLN